MPVKHLADSETHGRLDQWGKQTHGQKEEEKTARPLLLAMRTSPREREIFRQGPRLAPLQRLRGGTTGGIKRKRQIADCKRVATNLFQDMPTSLPNDLVETLLKTEHVRIERIVSTGQSSPENFWYDQDEGEWVILLRGAATLEFAGDIGMRRLCPGDYLFIPAHQKHRIIATSTKKPAVWLAVFVKEKKVATKCCVRKKRAAKKAKTVKKRAVIHPSKKLSAGQQFFDFGK